MVMFSEAMTEIITIKNPKTNPQTWYVNEILLVNMTYCISLKSSQKVLLNARIFENVD